MDPTPAELNGFSTISYLVTWVGILGKVTDANSVAGSLGPHCLVGTQPVWTLAAIPEADLVACLATGQTGDPPAAPSPAQRGQAVELGRIARVRCGIEPSR